MSDSQSVDEQALIAADEKARIDSLDVSRSFIVQAPAGSGKTELLIQRYLKLLAVVEEPEEVLAITFTRKAALEMQMRVINALCRARDGAVAEAEHEQRTLDAAGDVLARDTQLGWRLIESPGRMRIDTIDAFGAGVARSLPLTSGQGAAARVLADAEMDRLYEEAAAATLDYLATPGGNGEHVEQLLAHLDNATGIYISHLARMLASREQWLSITGGGIADPAEAAAVRRDLESNLGVLIESQIRAAASLMPASCRQELPDLLAYAAKSLRDNGRDAHPLAALADADWPPDNTVDDRLAWQALADALLTKGDEWRKTVDVRSGFPPKDNGEKAAMKALLATLPGNDAFRDALARVRSLPEPSYRDDQWQVLLALFNLLPLAAAELRRLFSERGISDHNEVAISAGSALGSFDAPGELALMLDYRISHLLVDEMQDTSLAQYEFLQKLTAGWTGEDGRTIFCVGDPMQSIYRFRDAEVGEFLLARQRGIGNVALESLQLRRNFRSGENLVHWFNTVFSQIMPLEDNVPNGAISYSESAPVPQSLGIGEARVHPLFSVDEEAEAKRVAGLVGELLDGHPDESIAVLVRSRTQLPLLLKYLRHASVEYHAVEIDRLTDLPEIIDLLALTRALCHDADRLAWLALLRGPWIGVPWRDLQRLVADDRHSTVPDLLASEDRLGRMVADTVARIRHALQAIAPYRARHTSRSLRDRVEEAWFALDGPGLVVDAGALDNVYRFLDVLDKLDVAGTMLDVTDLERWLDAERVSSTVSSRCRVQIMTMHKAKGLEFDHVVLHALGRKARGTSKEVLRWLNLPDGAGRSDMVIAPVGPRTEMENDPLHQFIEATEKAKTKLELDRLLYVACTRARRSLHLVGHVAADPESESVKPPDSRSLLYRLWVAVEREYQREFERWQNTGADSDDADEDGVLVAPVLRRVVHQAGLPEVPALPTDLPAASRPREGTEAIDYYWVGAAARHAGTIVHRWLQRLAEGRAAITADSIDDSRQLSARWARQLGVEENEVATVGERVAEALTGILGDDKGQWLLQGEGSAEVRVSGIMDGVPENIIIDRVRIDDDGTHWIVDYKTSTHEGGDLEGFLQQEKDRYRPQLEKYAHIYRGMTDAPVRTALYFPLLQSFVEVDVD